MVATGRLTLVRRFPTVLFGPMSWVTEVLATNQQRRKILLQCEQLSKRHFVQVRLASPPLERWRTVPLTASLFLGPSPWPMNSLVLAKRSKQSERVSTKSRHLVRPVKTCLACWKKCRGWPNSQWKLVDPSPMPCCKSMEIQKRGASWWTGV